MSNFKLNPKFKFLMFYIESMQAFEYITQYKILIFWIANVELQTQAKIQTFNVLYRKHASFWISNIKLNPTFKSFWMF